MGLNFIAIYLFYLCYSFFIFYIYVMCMNLVQYAGFLLISTYNKM